MHFEISIIPLILFIFPNRPVFQNSPESHFGLGRHLLSKQSNERYLSAAVRRGSTRVCNTKGISSRGKTRSALPAGAAATAAAPPTGSAAGGGSAKCSSTAGCTVLCLRASQQSRVSRGFVLVGRDSHRTPRSSDRG